MLSIAGIVCYIKMILTGELMLCNFHIVCRLNITGCQDKYYKI